MSKHPPEDHHAGPTADNGGRAEQEFSIARSNALAPLLVLFAATVLGILFVVVRAKPVISPTGVIANKAYGPADFPVIFQKEDALTASASAGARGASLTYPVPAPPFSEGIFPCMQCHEGMPANPERRKLEMHSEIELHHDEEHRWCLDCHDANDRDHLRTASGVLVPFTESYRLCGQCHGTQYRDWRVGIHGKRTGYWDGSKRYLLCVHCHNPHSPRFAALKPLPPPVRPQFLREEDASKVSIAGHADTKNEEGHAGRSH